MPEQVWDIQVRLMHWALAAFFLAAYFLEGNWRGMHTHLGYTILLLVGLRLIWGAAGSHQVRFASFVRSPAAAMRYGWKLLRGDAPAYAGHDPAGAMMIVALLFGLTVTGLTGLTLYGLEGNGPLAAVVPNNLPGAILETTHAIAADTTAGLAVVHVLGVVFASIRQRENLILAMWTGRKRKGGSAC